MIIYEIYWVKCTIELISLSFIFSLWIPKNTYLACICGSHYVSIIVPCLNYMETNEKKIKRFMKKN